MRGFVQKIARVNFKVGIKSARAKYAARPREPQGVTMSVELYREWMVCGEPFGELHKLCDH